MTSFNPPRFLSRGLLCFTLLAPTVQAASLTEVNGWSPGNLPSDVSMHVYVPDDVADNPPILVLIHFCGGTAAEVFGQAQGGGLVAAADQHGFIMVVPSSDRCWDVVSDKTFTRDGGGDSHAIMEMVRYAIDEYGGNADRVYATGDSSGGMMTELLLALYPDVFKAGSAFAGMPAGCRGDNESGNGSGYSGACAGGMVMRSEAEWGEIARDLYPGYTGHRPRVQIFHGDNDTIIRYANHTEAIKEWVNVLDLSTTPTATDTGLSLGDHQATRQRWENACGYVVLDAFTSLGGDHGPSDALFVAEYVVPFLGLDRTGPLDPEIEECGDSPGMGGAGAGGEGGLGGSSGAGQGGSGNAAGGAGLGGTAGTSGATGGANMGGMSGAPIGENGGSGGGGMAGAPIGGAGSSGSAGIANTSGASGSGGAGGPPASGGAGNGATPTPAREADAGESGCAIGAAPRPNAGGYLCVALGLALAAARRRFRRVQLPPGA